MSQGKIIVLSGCSLNIAGVVASQWCCSTHLDCNHTLISILFEVFPRLVFHIKISVKYQCSCVNECECLLLLITCSHFTTIQLVGV